MDEVVEIRTKNKDMLMCKVRRNSDGEKELIYRNGKKEDIILYEHFKELVESI